MNLFAVLLFVCLTGLPKTDSLSNAGKTFVQTFNFNHPSVENGVLHAFILSTDAASCDVNVTYGTPATTDVVPLTSSQAVVHTLTIASTVGVKLQATCDFIVYGLNFATQSADGWLALPVESLGSEYAILGVQPWLAEPTQLTIVAANDNTTCTSTFPNGTQHVSTLNSVGVDYMTSTLDLTGTFISCTDKVAVLTGQRCSNFPQGCIACDHTIEQVPPKSTLGRNFAMVPLNHNCAAPPTCCTDPLFCSKCTEIYRIMAIEDNTVVVRNGTETTETFTLNKGQSQYILLSQTEFAHLVATKPVLLGQYFNGGGYEGEDQDPAFAIIPQIESYYHRYQAATCFPQFQQHFVNLVAPANSASDLLLNGATFLNPSSAVPIPGTNLEAFRYQFNCSGNQPMSFTIVHQQNKTFGLFAYGFSAWISYGYPGGMQLNDDVYFTCPPPSINLTSSGELHSFACNLTDAAPNFDTPIASEANCSCTGNSSLTHSDTVLESTPCLLKIERTWTYVDACGRSANASQIAVVEKELDAYQAPNSPFNFNGNCSDAQNSNETGRPILERNCGSTISVNFTDVTDNSTFVNRTWTVVQQCTNQTQVFQQTITCGGATTTPSNVNQTKTSHGTDASTEAPVTNATAADTIAFNQTSTVVLGDVTTTPIFNITETTTESSVGNSTEADTVATHNSTDPETSVTEIFTTVSENTVVSTQSPETTQLTTEATTEVTTASDFVTTTILTEASTSEAFVTTPTLNESSTAVSGGEATTTEAATTAEATTTAAAVTNATQAEPVTTTVLVANTTTESPTTVASTSAPNQTLPETTLTPAPTFITTIAQNTTSVSTGLPASTTKKPCGCRKHKHKCGCKRKCGCKHRRRCDDDSNDSDDENAD